MFDDRRVDVSARSIGICLGGAGYDISRFSVTAPALRPAGFKRGRRCCGYDCNEAIRPVHDRMPVLLPADEWDHWLHGSYDDALTFQARCFPDRLIAMERTSELWVKRKAAADPSI